MTGTVVELYNESYGMFGCQIPSIMVKMDHDGQIHKFNRGIFPSKYETEIYKCCGNEKIISEDDGLKEGKRVEIKLGDGFYLVGKVL